MFFLGDNDRVRFRALERRLRILDLARLVVGRVVAILVVLTWFLNTNQEFEKRWSRKILFGLAVACVVLVLGTPIETLLGWDTYSKFERNIELRAQGLPVPVTPPAVVSPPIPPYPEGVKVVSHPGFDRIELEAGVKTDPIVFNTQLTWDGEAGGDGHFIIINAGPRQWVKTADPDIHLTARGQIQFMGGPTGSVVLLYPPHRIKPRS